MAHWACGIGLMVLSASGSPGEFEVEKGSYNTARHVHSPHGPAGEEGPLFEEGLTSNLDKRTLLNSRRKLLFWHDHYPHYHNPHHHHPHYHYPHYHSPHSHNPHGHNPHSHSPALPHGGMDHFLDDTAHIPILVGILIIALGLVLLLNFACTACSWSNAEAEIAREARGTSSMRAGFLTHQHGRGLPASAVALTGDEGGCGCRAKMRAFNSIEIESPGLLTMSEYTVIRYMYTYAPNFSVSSAWCLHIGYFFWFVVCAVRAVPFCALGFAIATLSICPRYSLSSNIALSLPLLLPKPPSILHTALNLLPLPPRPRHLHLPTRGCNMLKARAPSA
jgi:hypothetical protein